MKIKGLFIIMSVLGWSSLVQADEGVPLRIYYQSLLEDTDGNLLTDSFVGMQLNILNQASEPIYSEDQRDIQVIDSAVNVSVGDQGLTPEMLDPRTGTKFLEVNVNNGQSVETMELGSVPYSVWSQKALGVAENSIGSEEIKDGSIQWEDLAEEITFDRLTGQMDLSQAPDGVATDQELSVHTDSVAAHPATAITVESNFSNSMGSTVQSILEDLDQKLSLEVNNRQRETDDLRDQLGAERSVRETADATLQTNIDTEESSRITADNTLQANINAEETARISAGNTLQSNISAEETARISTDGALTTAVNAAQSTADTGVSNAATAQATANTAVANAATAQGTANTGVSNAAAAQGTANTALSNAATAQSTADSKLSRAGGTMTGGLNMGGSAITNVAMMRGTADSLTLDFGNGQLATMGSGSGADGVVYRKIIEATIPANNGVNVLTIPILADHSFFLTYKILGNIEGNSSAVHYRQGICTAHNNGGTGVVLSGGVQTHDTQGQVFSVICNASGNNVILRVDEGNIGVAIIPHVVVDVEWGFLDEG